MVVKNQKPTDKKEKEGKVKQPPPAVVEARENRAYFLHLVQGLTYREVTVVLNREFPAYPLKSDHQAVQKMVWRVVEANKKRDQDLIEEIRAESAARLDYATRKAVDAVESFSEGKGIEKTVKKKVDKPIEQTLKEIGVDSKLLNVISTNAMRKAELFGAVASKKLEHSGPNGGPIPVQPFDMDAWKKEREKRLKEIKNLEE